MRGCGGGGSQRYCPMGENVKVILPGGELYIVYKADCGVTLTGGAEFVFKGTINV